MLTICRRHWFRPACWMHFLKVGSCSLGEHDATTTRWTPFSLMALMISSWPRSEQVYLFSLATTTPGSFSASPLTLPQSTTPAMLLPQWQTKTPILGPVVLPDSFVGALVPTSLSCGAGAVMSHLPRFRLDVSRPARVTPRKVADSGCLAHPLGPIAGLTFLDNKTAIYKGFDPTFRNAG